MKRSSRLEIKVAPGASKNSLQGFVGDALKVAVTAPPERGKANKAVLRVLADQLAVPPRNLRIIRGDTASRKTIEVDDLSAEELKARLQRAVP